MDYEHIDVVPVEEDASLHADARDLVSRAIMMEYEANRLELLGGDNLAYLEQAKVQKEAAEAAKKEADAFIKASKFPKEEVVLTQKEFLINAIRQLETQHLQLVRRTDIRRTIGMRMADSDSELTRLERCKDMAVRMLRQIGGPEATKRTNGKAAGATKKS